MPRENPRAHLTRQWLTLAGEDLLVAERLLGEPPLPGVAAFHAQQAAEKALKGLLAWHDRPFARTHDLGELVDQCAGIVVEFSAMRTLVSGLTRFAVLQRYPPTGEQPTPPDAAGWLGVARQVYEMVVSNIPAEVQP
jgi:HEPN domain-containing protein